MINYAISVVSSIITTTEKSYTGTIKLCTKCDNWIC